jgi:hypothetical protein
MLFYIYDDDDLDSSLKWNYLLQNTFIVFTEPRILNKLVPISKQWIASYEQKNSYILPQDYKDFINTYGAGHFGNNNVNILTPGAKCEEERVLAMQVLRDSFDALNLDPKFKIVENGYFFGHASSGTSFILDLNSYSSEDLCCDIYVINLSIEPLIICLGRDFYFFIRELCLNNKIDEWLLEGFSLSQEEEDDEGQQKDISTCSGVFIPYWTLPESWG